MLGWPSLDSPVVAKSEGLGWRIKPDGFEYTALGVTIPRTDDVRRVQYVANLVRYYTINEGAEPESVCRVTEPQNHERHDPGSETFFRISEPRDNAYEDVANLIGTQNPLTDGKKRE